MPSPSARRCAAALRARTWLVGIAWLHGAGCLAAPARPCERDAECVLQAELGTCQPPGFCVYDSDRCPAGEYGPYAGGGLAGRCFEPPAAGSGDSTTSAPASTTRDAESTSSTSSGDTNAASTSSETETSGGPIPSVEEIARWTPAGPVLDLGDIDVGAFRIAVAGTIDVDGDALLLRVLSDTGDEIWTADPLLPANARGEFVAIDPTGEVVVAGGREIMGVGDGMYVRRFFAAGGERRTRSFDIAFTGAGFDESSATVLAGLDLPSGYIVRLTAALDTDWTDQDGPFVPTAADVRPDGTIVLAGPLQEAGFGLKILSEAGVVLREDTDPDPQGRTVAQLATRANAIIVAITVAGGDARWVAGLDAGGAEQWSTEADVSTIADVALGPAGQILVAGARASDGRETVLQQLDAGGAAQWTVELGAGGFVDAVVAVGGLDTFVAAIAAGGREVAIWRVTP